MSVIEPTKMGLKYDPPTIAFSYFRQERNVKKRRLYVVTLRGLVNLPNSQLITEKIFNEHPLFLNDYKVDFGQVKHLVDVMLSRIRVSAGSQDEQLVPGKEFPHNNGMNLSLQFNENQYQREESNNIHTPPLINRSHKRTNLLQNLNQQYLENDGSQRLHEDQEEDRIQYQDIINNVQEDPDLIQTQKYFTPPNKQFFQNPSKKDESYNVSSLLGRNPDFSSSNKQANPLQPKKKNQKKRQNNLDTAQMNISDDMNPDFEPITEIDTNLKRGSIFENEFIDNDQQLIIGYPEKPKKNSNDEGDFWNQVKPGSNSPANDFHQKKSRKRENNIMFIENEVFDNSIPYHNPQQQAFQQPSKYQPQYQQQQQFQQQQIRQQVPQRVQQQLSKQPLEQIQQKKPKTGLGLLKDLKKERSISQQQDDQDTFSYPPSHDNSYLNYQQGYSNIPNKQNNIINLNDFHSNNNNIINNRQINYQNNPNDNHRYYQDLEEVEFYD